MTAHQAMVSPAALRECCSHGSTSIVLRRFVGCPGDSLRRAPSCCARIVAAFAICAYACGGMAIADTLLVPSQYPTIQAAIDAALPGDEVVVADGTYTGDGNRDIDFLGKAITVRSENGAKSCIIDCQGTIHDNHRGFNIHSGEANDSVVDGLTIVNGFHGNNDNVQGAGGGLLITNSSPTIRNCTISNCMVEGHSSSIGGGIAVFDGSPVIMNCTIVACTASGGDGPVSGGGAYVDNETLINGCTFEKNSLGGAITRRGGGVRLTDQAIITQSTIVGNSGGTGGGVFAGGNSQVRECLISGNIGAGGMGAGGGGFAVSNNAVIESCRVFGNEGGHANYSGGGGGMCRDQSSIMNCLIAGNSTPGLAGR